MATVKVILDTRIQKKDKTYAVKLRFTLGKKSFYKPINIHLLKKYWDSDLCRVKKSQPNYKEYNIVIQQKLLDIQQLLLQLENSNPKYSLQDIKEVLKPTKATTDDVFSFSYKLIEQQNKAGRTGNAISYKQAVDKLSQQVNYAPIKFKDITYKLLTNWETDMRADGLKVNTIACYYRAIRAIFNIAIKEGVADVADYPFTKYKIKTERTVQRTLTKEQIQQIEQLDLPPNSQLDRARDFFLLSFYLIGINFRDLAYLQKSNLRDGRIIYQRKKTKKIYSVKIQPKAQIILDKYKTGNDYLLPIININRTDVEEQVKQIKSFLKNMNNRGLKPIGKTIGLEDNLTTYYARYSWANIARKLGYSKDLIAEALGHEYGNKVTGIYLDQYDLDVIDEANAKVIA